MTTYTGGCHCGAVRYEFEGVIEEAMECNCSDCAKKGMLPYFVDKDKFKLLKGADNLGECQLNNRRDLKTIGQNAEAMLLGRVPASIGWFR